MIYNLEADVVREDLITPERLLVYQYTVKTTHIHKTPNSTVCTDSLIF